MEQLVGFLGILIVFGAIIAVHEFGHFIVAKRSGMGVHEFSLGLGPALFKKQIGETLYAIRAVPFGGFVRIAGMEPGEEDAPNGFETKPFPAKFLTILAGSAMNFVLALVVLIVMGMALGFPKGDPRPVIGGMFPDGPAARAGLKAGDRFVEIAGEPTPTWDRAVDLIRNSPPPIAITVERQGQLHQVSVTPREIDYYERKKLRMKKYTRRGIGIVPSWVREKAGPLESAVVGFEYVGDRILDSLVSMGAIITGQVPTSGVGGPVKIGELAYKASNDALLSVDGLANFLSLLALLSVSIGVLNLLPIPALDGSRLLFLTIEAVRGKPFNKEKEALVHLVGFALLLGLIVLITFKDIKSMIFSGG